LECLKSDRHFLALAKKSSGHESENEEIDVEREDRRKRRLQQREDTWEEQAGQGDLKEKVRKHANTLTPNYLIYSIRKMLKKL
jgi:hypothetical protein